MCFSWSKLEEDFKIPFTGLFFSSVAISLIPSFKKCPWINVNGHFTAFRRSFGVTDQYADDIFILEISTNQTSDNIDLLVEIS